MSPAPDFLDQLIGLRGETGYPNISDKDSAASVAISRHMLEALGLASNRVAAGGQSVGARMETLVADDLRTSLEALAPERGWSVDRPGRKLSRFAQYGHLATLQRLIEQDDTKVLGMAIGREYEVAPDITIGLVIGLGAEGAGAATEGLPLLHASVSCKLTIRSDRVQNIRQESAVLTRQRRGRLPHVVAVTLEPLPTRIAAIARGTGDVDAVYHPAFDELRAAVDASGNEQQAETLDELIGQGRLLNYSRLARTLAIS